MAAAISLSAQPENENIIPVIKGSPDVLRLHGASGDFVVSEIRGSVKTKANFLPKPVYPQEAIASGVEGIARVEVTVDEKGVVTGAKMLSGDMLFQSVVEDAALRSRFKPAVDLAGLAIKTDGVLVYSFEIKKANWTRFALDLRFLETSPRSAVTFPPLLKALSPDWADEIAILIRIRGIMAISYRRPVLMPAPMNPTISGRKFPGGMSSSSSASGMVIMPTVTPLFRTLTADLKTALRSRLASDELASWQFELGTDLSNALMLATSNSPRNQDPGRFLEASNIIKSRLDAKPKNVSTELIKALEDLQKDLGTEKRSKEQDSEIQRALDVILNER